MVSSALPNPHSATVTHLHLIWRGGVTQGCVIPRAYLKLAPVTAEAKVREGDDLRHHQRIVVDVMKAGARTEKQALWSADHMLEDGR